MSKSAATEELLGRLHAKVAAVMLGTLDNVEAAQEAYNKALENAVDDTMAEALVLMPEISPAFLSAVTKFLNDNKITCNVEEDKTMGSLEERLAQKRQRTRKAVGNILPFEPED
jgi:hypothetical protein